MVTEKKQEKVFESYTVSADSVTANVKIVQRDKEFVKEYLVEYPEFGPGTRALLNSIKINLLREFNIPSEKLINQEFLEGLKTDLKKKATDYIVKENTKVSKEDAQMLSGILIQEMLGLGKIDLILGDGNLEELVINQSKEPIWVYHKGHGWLKTDVRLANEAEIQNYASIIARRVGKQITTLDPLLDAHLTSGDRVNATLAPISNDGNTITIRRFRRDPWTVTDLIRNNTVSSDLMALVWEGIQYELNIVFSGGTASGKTTILGICLPFIQPNHRLLSIEDTRELKAPDYLHWIPMVTREPNPEGKGQVEMIDLLVNALRMRPDRIIVGEIRREKEAEVMFEAMHTGHSVLTTVHANTAEETIRRLINPPINTPPTMLGAIHLNVVMFRNRRLGVRRALQVAEFFTQKRAEGQETVAANILYRWRASDDKIVAVNESIRLFDELALHTGLSKSDILREIEEKKKILEWMVQQNIHEVNDIGHIVAQYYKDKNVVFEMMKEKK